MSHVIGTRELMPFEFESNTVRIAKHENGDAFVCLKDLLQAMGSTTRTNQILPELQETFGDGYKILIPIVDSLGRPQETTFVSESAAMFIVSRGRTEVSRRLNRWLFGEVLPSIKKHGAYIMNQEKEEDPKVLISKALIAANSIIEEQAARLEKAKVIFLEQKPQVEAYKQFLDREGLFTLRDTAKHIGIPERVFVRFLVADGYAYHTAGKNPKLRPTAERSVHTGLIALKVTKDVKNVNRGQMMFTAKGMDFFLQRYSSMEVV